MPPKDYIAAIAAVSLLPAEAICHIDSKMCWSIGPRFQITEMSLQPLISTAVFYIVSGWLWWLSFCFSEHWHQPTRKQHTSVQRLVFRYRGLCVNRIPTETVVSIWYKSKAYTMPKIKPCMMKKNIQVKMFGCITTILKWNFFHKIVHTPLRCSWGLLWCFKMKHDRKAYIGVM